MTVLTQKVEIAARYPAQHIFDLLGMAKVVGFHAVHLFDRVYTGDHEHFPAKGFVETD